ncbi:hypothetical protein ACGF7U_10915 [Micromonospora sp. NPDC047670]|uniref:hypothetical protein n=1 Tax=Micromonospora sp. NPDC047670 TaxID=3364252 RepID=UPI003723D0AC
MTEREGNVQVVRRYLRTFVTRDLAELRAVVGEDRVVVSMAQTYRRGDTGWPASTARCTAR